MIPKNIYYTWFGGAPKSKIVIENINRWKILNPDYKVIEINETNFDVNVTCFSRKASENKKWAFVSDVARLATIYQFGGFYFDTDVKLLKPLDVLSDLHEFYGLQNSGEVNTGSGFGAEPKSSLIKEQLEAYSDIEFCIEDLKQITNVKMASNIFTKNGLKAVDKTQYIGSAIILSSKYLTPLHFWGGGKIDKDTIAVHQFGNTWGDNNKASFLGKTRLNMRLKSPKLEQLISHILWLIFNKEK